MSLSTDLLWSNHLSKKIRKLVSDLAMGVFDHIKIKLLLDDLMHGLVPVIL